MQRRSLRRMKFAREVSTTAGVRWYHASSIRTACGCPLLGPLRAAVFRSVSFLLRGSPPVGLSPHHTASVSGPCLPVPTRGPTYLPTYLPGDSPTLTTFEPPPRESYTLQKTACWMLGPARGRDRSIDCETNLGKMVGGGPGHDPPL